LTNEFAGPLLRREKGGGERTGTSLFEPTDYLFQKPAGLYDKLVVTYLSFLSVAAIALIVFLGSVLTFHGGSGYF